MLEKRINLFGVKIDDIPLKRAVFLAYKSMVGGERRCFFTPNLQMLASAKENDELKKLLNSSSVSLPDGFSLKILAKMLGIKIDNTVPGIDFGEALLEIAEEEGANVFLLGGKRGVAERAAKNVANRYTRIKICGAFHGYFKEKHGDAICKMIEKSRADILIVCQGFPKQERFANLVMEKVDCVKVIACLGGTFDVWSGDVKRAPKLMRKFHLEWLWRIANEPSRCTRFVQSLDCFPFAFKVGLEKYLSLGMKGQK